MKKLLVVLVILLLSGCSFSLLEIHKNIPSQPDGKVVINTDSNEIVINNRYYFKNSCGFYIPEGMIER